MVNEAKLQIYPGREKNFEKELKKLETFSISQKNKELITTFQNYLFTRSGELRVAKVSSQLRRICLVLNRELKINKDLDNWLRDDAVKIVAFYNRQKNLSDATKADYRRVIKQFYNWFKTEDKRLYSPDAAAVLEIRKFYDYLEKEVTESYKRKQADPNTIINEQEIEKVVDASNSAKEQAFVTTLHEWGLRAAEFLNLKIGNIIQKENYAEINVPDMKTGNRVVYAIKSLPYLLRYLETHPFRKNDNAYLWLSDARFNRYDPILHSGGQKLINRCFEKAGIKKKHNWHWFRHSRATILAPKMTEAILCKYMGWAIGSRQVKIYVHLCVKQLEDVVMSINGLKTKEEEPNPTIKCVCGAMNAVRERYCNKCFKPLNVSVLVQDKELLDTEMNKTMRLMREMTANPDLMRTFSQFREQWLKANEKNQ